MKNDIQTSYNSITEKYELNINGQFYSSSNMNEFRIPLSVIENIEIREFPVGLTIIPDVDNMPDFKDQIIEVSKIKNSAGKKIEVEFNSCRNAEDVSTYFITYILYQETLADLLLLNKKIKPKILVNEFNGVRFYFYCSIKVPNDSIGNLILRTFEFFHTTRRKILRESLHFREILRKNLNLSANPSKQARVRFYVPKITPLVIFPND